VTSTILYVARASAQAGGGYRAEFPDLPGLSVTAPDTAELLQAARQALAAHLREMADAGEAWPTATPVEAVPLAAGAFPLLVDVPVDDRPVRVNISLGERLLERLDAAAEASGMTRSGFIAQAVRVSLGERGAGKEFETATRRLQDELQTLGRKINDSLGPGSAFSRRMMDLDDQVYDGVRKVADSVSAAMARRRQAGKAAAAPEPDASSDA
jgi:predicted RNase H-like HicB family nuclease